MSVEVRAVGRSEVPPHSMPDRFRHEITYFAIQTGTAQQPALPRQQFIVPLADSQSILEEGVLRLVSPLDSQNRAEIELSEELEEWLEWMVRHQIELIELVSK